MRIDQDDMSHILADLKKDRALKMEFLFFSLLFLHYCV